MGRLIALLTLFFCLSETMAQDIDINLLLDKKWTITDYFVGDMKVPTTKHENHTIFGKDHSVEAFDEGILLRSMWTFNSEKQILILSSDTSKEKSEMKIHKLAQDEFKYEITTEEGMELIIVMRPKN